jgi:hypothetical protein
MFGYTLIKKSELEKLQEESSKYLILKKSQEESSKYLSIVCCGYWFSGFQDFYKVINKFIKGEVGSHNFWEIREELFRSLGIDRYLRPFGDSKIVIPAKVFTSESVPFISKLNKNSDNSIGPSEFTGSVQRIGDKMLIFRPVNGSRPVGYEYEDAAEVIKVFHNPAIGYDFIIEMVKVKGWTSGEENSNDAISKKD